MTSGIGSLLLALLLTSPLASSRSRWRSPFARVTVRRSRSGAHRTVIRVFPHSWRLRVLIELLRGNDAGLVEPWTGADPARPVLSPTIRLK